MIQRNDKILEPVIIVANTNTNSRLARYELQCSTLKVERVSDYENSPFFSNVFFAVRFVSPV